MPLYLQNWTFANSFFLASHIKSSKLQFIQNIATWLLTKIKKNKTKKTNKRTSHQSCILFTGFLQNRVQDIAVRTWKRPPLSYRAAPPTQQNLFSSFQQLLPSPNSQNKSQHHGGIEPFTQLFLICGIHFQTIYSKHRL